MLKSKVPKRRKAKPLAMKGGFFAEFDPKNRNILRKLYTRQVPQLIELLGLETVTYFVAAFGAVERVTSLNDLSVLNDTHNKKRRLAHDRNANALFLLMLSALNELWKVVKELRKHVAPMISRRGPITAWNEVERVFVDWEHLEGFQTIRNSLGHHAAVKEIRAGLQKTKHSQMTVIFSCDRPANGETSFPVALESALRGTDITQEQFAEISARVVSGTIPLEGGLLGTFAELLRRKGIDFRGERPA